MKRIALTLALVLCVVSGAHAQFSAMSPTRISDCCYDFSVGNFSTSGIAVTEFSMKLVAPGASILPGVQTPAGWTITSQTATTIRFASSVDSITAGDRRTGFIICFNVPGNTFSMPWVTANGTSTIELGQLSLACRPECDRVETTTPAGTCCSAFTIHNRNIWLSHITRVSLRVVTPGFTFGGLPTAPAGWGLSAFDTSNVSFLAIGAPLAYGDSLAGFLACLQPVITGSPIARIAWATFVDSTLLCTDTMTVVCSGGTTPDKLTITQSVPGTCCYDFTLESSNSAKSPLNALNLELLTPGATFVGTPAGPWRARILTPTLLRFTGTSDLPAAGKLTGFTFCIDRGNAPAGPIQLRWKTQYNNLTISLVPTTISCTSAPAKHDTVSAVQATSPAPPADACTYAVTVRNSHTPAGTVEAVHLRIIVGGATFTGTPGGSWPVTQSTATDITWTPSAALASGKVQTGLYFFLKPTIPGVVPIVWETISASKIVSTDTLLVSCIPGSGGKDETRLRNISACQYNAGFTNRRAPGTVVNGFTVRLVAPGSTITAVTPPNGWTIASQFATSVRFTSTAGTARNVAQDGFLVTFNPPGAGVSFAVAMCTDVSGGAQMCDTVLARCTPDTRCDSLLSVKGADCSVRLGLVNLHTPVSAVTDFHLVVTTPGATLGNAVPPAGWIVYNRTPVLVDFRDTSGNIPPGGSVDGFEFSFNKAAGVPTVAYQWCSTFNGSTICCGTSSITCNDQIGQCDSLLVTPESGSCTFDFGIANAHSPVSKITQFRVSVLTPGALLLDATAPAGWKRISADTISADFISATGLDPGLIATGFRLSLLPTVSGSSISVGWCTSNQTMQLCCDSTLVECQIGPVSGDSVQFHPDALIPCCYDMEVFNVHQPAGNITAVYLAALTPGAEVFPGAGAPAGWDKSISLTDILWHTATNVIAPAQSLRGFMACFDNTNAGGAPIIAHWETRAGTQVVSADTFTVPCTMVGIGRVSDRAPRAFALHQNYPNPFNPSTSVEYDVPRSSWVRIAVLDASGRHVRDLVNTMHQPGTHRVQFDAGDLPGGVYFCRMTAGTFTEVRGMVVVK